MDKNKMALGSEEEEDKTEKAPGSDEEEDKTDKGEHNDKLGAQRLTRLQYDTMVTASLNFCYGGFQVEDTSRRNFGAPWPAPWAFLGVTLWPPETHTPPRHT